MSQTVSVTTELLLRNLAMSAISPKKSPLVSVATNVSSASSTTTEPRRRKYMEWAMSWRRNTISPRLKITGRRKRRMAEMNTGSVSRNRGTFSTMAP